MSKHLTVFSAICGAILSHCTSYRPPLTCTELASEIVPVDTSRSAEIRQGIELLSDMGRWSSEASKHKLRPWTDPVVALAPIEHRLEPEIVWLAAAVYGRIEPDRRAALESQSLRDFPAELTNLEYELQYRMPPFQNRFRSDFEAEKLRWARWREHLIACDTISVERTLVQRFYVINISTGEARLLDVVEIRTEGGRCSIDSVVQWLREVQATPD